jgi:hypothetical protein
MAYLTIDEVEEFQQKPFKIRGNSQTYTIKHHGFGDRSLMQSDDEKTICIGTIPLSGFTHVYFTIQFKHHGLSCEKKIYYRDTYPADSKTAL